MGAVGQNPHKKELITCDTQTTHDLGYTSKRPAETAESAEVARVSPESHRDFHQPQERSVTGTLSSVLTIPGPFRSCQAVIGGSRGDGVLKSATKRCLWGFAGCLVLMAVCGFVWRDELDSSVAVSEMARQELDAPSGRLGVRRPERTEVEGTYGEPRLLVSPRPVPGEATRELRTGFDLEVSGTVVDATGGCVVDATVSAHADSVQLASTQSGEEGQFTLRLPPGEFEIVARAEAYSDALLWVRAPAREVRLMVAPSASLLGRVVAHSTSEPIAGVTVFAEGPEGTAHRPRSAATGSGGVFSFSGLAAGRYQLEASSAAWRSGRHWVTVSMGEQMTGLELRASAAGVLAATLLVDNEPCADGFVRLNGPVWSNAVVQGGRARVEGVVPGAYELSAGCEGAAVTLTESAEFGLGLTARSWNLSAGLSLRGSVLGANAEPLATAHVRVLPERGTAGANVDCWSDPAGDFECRGLLPGEHTCEVVGEFGALSEPISVRVSSENMQSVVLRTFPSASIRASLAPGEPRGVAQGVFARRAGYPALTGRGSASGQVSFENLPLGSYVVYVGADGEHDAHARVVQLKQQAQIVDVVLSAPLTSELAGRVLDARGEPVLDAWVRASSRRSAIELPAVLTDSEGRFSVPDVIVGARYDLDVDSSEGPGRLMNVEPGREWTLQIRPSGSLTLRVRSEDGSPAASFEVAYRRLDGAQENGVQHGVGARGEWHSPRIELGHWKLLISSGGRYASRELVLLEGDPLSVGVVLEGGGALAEEFWAAELAQTEQQRTASAPAAPQVSMGEHTRESSPSER